MEELQEFVVSDFQKQASHITKKHKKIRTSLLGKEKTVSKLLKWDKKNSRITWFCPVTFQLGTRVNFTTNKPAKNQSPFYLPQIEMVEFKKWFPKGLKNVSYEEFKETLSVVDVRLACDCMAFTYQGMRWQLTGLDSSIHPIHIPDPVWGPRHKGKHAICKHLLGIINNWSAWQKPIYRMIKSSK